MRVLLGGGAEWHAAATRFLTTTRQAADEPMPGALERYELVEALGQGAMGVAFGGRSAELGRKR